MSVRVSHDILIIIHVQRSYLYTCKLDIRMAMHFHSATTNTPMISKLVIIVD